MYVRKAVDDDLNQIMEMYRIAQDFMIESGNPTQWGHSYPSRDLIKQDIDDGTCHVICKGNIPHGVFALLGG